MNSGTPSTTGSQSQNQGQAGQTPYTIPQVVLDEYPQLVDLIKKTESMSQEEREYWFQILPIMTEDQVKRLQSILEEEAAQLAKLDDQYKDEISKLNKKHLEEWDVFQKKQEREALKAEEASHEAQEKAAEESILQELDGSTSALSSPPPAQP